MVSHLAMITAAFGLASIFASASAQDVLYPEPITIGQFAYPHGHQILACKRSSAPIPPEDSTGRSIR